MNGHELRMRVNWVDTDAGGRIHHTAAFRWAELAEHDLYRELGIEQVDKFPRRHVEATYHLPLRFNDEFDFLLTPERIGASSVVYSWAAHRDGQLCIEGRSVIVHVNEDGVPAPLPPAISKGLASRANR